MDLHAWSIGPGYRAVILSVETSKLCQRLDVVRLIPDTLGIAHHTVEMEISNQPDKNAAVN